MFDEYPDDKDYKCRCDGKHVCGRCIKKEKDYYKGGEDTMAKTKPKSKPMSKKVKAAGAGG